MQYFPLRNAIVGSDSISRNFQGVGAMISVAPASRRLLALSWDWKTADKMTALPHPARESLRAKRGRQLPAQTRGTKSARAGPIPRVRNPSAHQASCIRRIHRDGRNARRADVRAWAGGTAPA